MSLKRMHKMFFFQVCQGIQKRPKWRATLGEGWIFLASSLKGRDLAQDWLILTLATFPARQCLVPSLATSCLLLMSSPGIPAGLLRSREENHMHMSISCSSVLWWMQGLCADNAGKSLILGRSTTQMCISPPSCLLPYSSCPTPSWHMQMLSYQVLCNTILEGGKIR